MENESAKLGKKELVEKLADKMGMNKSQTEELLGDMFGSISEILSEGYTISVPRFGKFVVYNSEGYKGRNPATGESVDVPPKKKIKFKPSNILKDLVREDIVQGQ